MPVICDLATLLNAARCFKCIPIGMQRDVLLRSICNWSSGGGAITEVILPDGAGGFWKLIVDTLGNLGAESDPGPQTADVVLDDGSGGFWLVIADTSGNRGTQTDAGPATTPPVISDGFAGNWQLVVDTSGNLGTTSV